MRNLINFVIVAFFSVMLGVVTGTGLLLVIAYFLNGRN